MHYHNLGSSSVAISQLIVGTWAFGSDAWWGQQDDSDSIAVMRASLSEGVTTFDTAPVYGKGHSEEVIGAYLAERGVRAQAIVATKLGLSWNSTGRIDHDLTREKMLVEIEESRRRLRTDYFDLYQVHWPDPKVPIAAVAESMNYFYQQHLMRAIGVSNFSIGQLEEFIRHAPLHCLQSPYNMFHRELESEIIPFCIQKNIALIVYVPLCSGVLTGKFFFGEKIPQDICRRKHKELGRERFHINKNTVQQLKTIADRYRKSLAQLVLCWTAMQKGVTGVIVGCRNERQFKENLGGFNWQISAEDLAAIEQLLDQRKQALV